MGQQSVTDNPDGAKQAQVTDPAKSQFGVAQVSSAPATGLTKEDLEKEVRRAETRIGMEWRRRLDEAELKGVTDPEENRAIKAAQEARRREDEATQKLADAEEMENRATAALSRAERLEANAVARELAVKYSIDPAQLLQFTEGRIAQMEDLAKLLPKVQPGRAAAQTTSQTTSFRPDSGQNVGGGNLPLETLVGTDTRRMSPTELREHKRLIEAHTKGLAR